MKIVGNEKKKTIYQVFNAIKKSKQPINLKYYIQRLDRLIAGTFPIDRYCIAPKLK